MFFFFFCTFNIHFGYPLFSDWTLIHILYIYFNSTNFFCQPQRNLFSSYYFYFLLYSILFSLLLFALLILFYLLRLISYEKIEALCITINTQQKEKKTGKLLIQLLWSNLNFFSLQLFNNFFHWYLSTFFFHYLFRKILRFCFFILI